MGSLSESRAMIGSSLDIHHNRHCIVRRAVCYPLRHCLKVLLGRCFPSAFSHPPHSSRGRIHCRISIFRPNSENRSQRRSRPAPYRPFLPHLSTTQIGGNATGFHGTLVGESYIPNILSASLRRVTHFYSDMVGGCCIHLCFVLGMHWQHIYTLRIGE